MGVLIEEGFFFESPRWHDGRWWVSDFYTRDVSSFRPDGSDIRREATVEGMPSGLGWRPDGTLLVVSMTDRRLLRRAPDGAIDVVAELAEFAGGPCNDMVVDPAGRAWIGNFGYDFFGRGKFAPACLIRVDPDATASVVADDLRFPNGSVITPDGSTLIVGQTFGESYLAFTITEDGSLVDRRVWAEVPGVSPDGCCLDADGRIWCADAGGHSCVLVEKGGRIISEVLAPDSLHPYACMLGGPNGTTLLQCCAPDSHMGRRMANRESVLITTEVDVPRAGLP
jgi:sugar lactone lactonase YvrE